MNFLKLLFISVLLSTQTISAHETASISSQTSWTEALHYAHFHLTHEGPLLRKQDGFVYVKVDDRYIRELFPLLDLTDKEFHPVPYFRSESAPGAHISVFYVSEDIIPTELGLFFPFEVKRIELVEAKHATYAILVVESPALEKLREHYHLNPKLQNHEFHISIAKKNRY